MPPVDIFEAEEEVLVAVELPGVEADDIEVRVAGDVLTLEGEKRGRDQLVNHPCIQREIYAGSFRRSFRLPARVAGGRIAPRFMNGVLILSIPKEKKLRHQER
jgi:HSP20 family protein